MPVVDFNRAALAAPVGKVVRYDGTAGGYMAYQLPLMVAVALPAPGHSLSNLAGWIELGSTQTPTSPVAQAESATRSPYLLC
jgi:hypothetical protein